MDYGDPKKHKSVKTTTTKQAVLTLMSFFRFKKNIFFKNISHYNFEHLKFNVKKKLKKKLLAFNIKTKV